MRQRALALSSATAVVAGLLVAAPSSPAVATSPPQDRREPPKVATIVGTGGAVSSVDPYASRVGLRVLKQGGNAVDAAVATAAALGVTEPYSAGIGGGGYFVYYDAASGKVRTIDGRETAPAEMTKDAFIDPETSEPYPFTPDLVTSGVSVGVPGTPATWKRALDSWGTWSLGRTLSPAAKLARRGFLVDRTFRKQTKDNQERFRTFTSTKRLFLRAGLPKVGSTFRNPDLAATYDLLGRRGVGALYRGVLAAEIVDAVRRPPVSGLTDLPVPPGSMAASDLAGYRAVGRRPSRVTYRGVDVYGMRPSSSGGSTVGEALNILERSNLAAASDVQALHAYLEAGALAFADRAEYVGDPQFTDVPMRDLLSQKYADERACLVNPAQAAPKPVGPGDVTSYDGVCGAPATRAPEARDDTEGVSTTNLTVADKQGNVVEYTLTIEQTGGSGIVVPGRGFLLNNELTDFTTEYEAGDPNRIQPGKRPRSSMSPTIVLQGGKPLLALGSPGGSTIITTVLQILLNRLDLGMTIDAALAAPRVSPRNTATVLAEQAFLDQYEALLEAQGHQLAPAGDPGTSAAEIGAATAIEFGPGGLMTVVAEPRRRGGGAATVVRPQ
jgi:gamma-glutamyltranspeptidase/glutathione hydrolase